MEWWQYILLYIGVWALGFATGLQAGMAAVIAKLSKPPMPQQQQLGPQDMAAMTQFMTPGGGIRQ